MESKLNKFSSGLPGAISGISDERSISLNLILGSVSSFVIIGLVLKETHHEFSILSHKNAWFDSLIINSALFVSILLVSFLCLVSSYFNRKVADHALWGIDQRSKYIDKAQNVHIIMQLILLPVSLVSFIIYFPLTIAIYCIKMIANKRHENDAHKERLRNKDGYLDSENKRLMNENRDLKCEKENLQDVNRDLKMRMKHCDNRLGVLQSDLRYVNERLYMIRHEERFRKLKKGFNYRDKPISNSHSIETEVGDAIDRINESIRRVDRDIGMLGETRHSKAFCTLCHDYHL